MIKRLLSDKRKLIKEAGFLALSFVIPFVILIVIMQVNGISLFSYSGNTIIMMDMQSEYVAYMSNLKYMLEHHSSFIYSTSKVFGGDYMSIYAFYLASPFNYLIVFFSYDSIPLFFAWTSIIKMAFASFNMYLLARFSSRFSYSKIIPCIGYGLITYSFIYMSNFMWLDGVMILPLVILGLLLLKKRNNYWLYPFAISYSLLTSWYIGYMICIFVGLYFLVLFFTDFKLKNKANYVFLLRFVIFSLFGGMISASWWLTAFIHLSGTKGTVAIPDFFNYSISILLTGFMEGNYEHVRLITQNNSYMSMFVGVVPVVFMITYFFNGKYALKERIIMGVLVIFYFYASINSSLSALLQGGREPTWFPTRYSFILGFIVCYLAIKSLDELDHFNPLYYLAPILLGIIAIIIVINVRHSERLSYYHISIISTVLYFVTILVGVGYSIINYYHFDKPTINKVKKYSPLLFIPLLAIEVISSYRGGNNVIKVNSEAHQYLDYETHLDDTSYMSSFDVIKQYEKDNSNSSFYRMETTFNRKGNYNDVDNNPMFYNFSGLSNFSSSSKKEVEKYMLKIGFHYNNFFAKYDGGSTYAINSLLGIKYLLEDKSNNENIHPYFLDFDTFRKLNLESDKGVNYYYNPYATTLAFQSDKSGSYFINEGNRINDDYVYWFDKFEYQNTLFRTLDNSIDKDIFYPLTINQISTPIEYEEDIMGIRTYKNVKSGNYININFTVPEEGIHYPLYLSEKDYVPDISYYVDGRKIEMNSYWHKGIHSFKDTGSHNHNLRIIFNKDYSSTTLRPELYYENIDISKEYMNSANQDEFIVDNISSSLSKYNFNGHINLSKKANKDLVFTIPYEREIHVKVDGKKVDTYKKYNIFTAIDLSSLEIGEHKIIIYYDDLAFKGSTIINIVGFVLLIPAIIFYKPLENRFFFKKEENAY